MESMFGGCSSLTNIDLSSFNTKNVELMSGMFSECKSLINLNLSSCDIKNNIPMNGIFYECKSLKQNGIITKDKKILKEFNPNLPDEKYNCYII